MRKIAVWKPVLRGDGKTFDRYCGVSIFPSGNRVTSRIETKKRGIDVNLSPDEAIEYGQRLIDAGNKTKTVIEMRKTRSLSEFKHTKKDLFS